MTKKQISISILLIFFSISCYPQKLITTKWQKEEYQQSENIPRDVFLYDNKDKLMYLISNDIKNLYIHLKVSNNSSIKKILDFGFTVWVDVKGTNKNKFGIKFPLEKKARMPSINLANHDKGRGREQRERPTLNDNYKIELIGFNNKKESSFMNAINNTDLNGKMRFNENEELEYDLSIPLKKLGINTIENNIISLKLESGTINIGNESRPGPTGRSGMGERNEGGGGHGGGHGGGRGGPGGQGMQQGNMQNKQGLSTPIKIKVKKIKLLQNEPI